MWGCWQLRGLRPAGLEFLMGYDVHLTRAARWLESETAPIALDEWLEYVEANEGFRHDGFAVATVDGSILRVESEGLSVWTAYGKNRPNGG